MIHSNPDELLNIRIVNYQPEYAKSLARMWNISGKAWNGHEFRYDEAKVLAEEENSGSFAVFLAIKEQEVLGYANIKLEEIDTLNLSMLNVIPEYHGRGIGKALVQRCVLETMHLGYPRISLFTWAGNTKAVPLYKKCGFFWQKLELNVTYLLNYIPGILSSELLAPYFDYFDWYQNNTRLLKVEPDGESDNGFDLYTHIWEKDGKTLRVVVEKTGFGIVEIETEDFHLKSKVEKAKPVFGNKQQIEYFFTAKNPDYASLKLQGISDESILYDYSFAGKAEQELHLVASYELKKNPREYTVWEPKPAVITKALIGGREIILRYGQEVQDPINLDLVVYNPVRPHCQATLYLNLESQLQEDATLRITMPSDEHLSIADPEFETSIASQEKKTLPISFVTTGSAVYAPKLQLDIKTNSSHHLSYEKDLSCIIQCMRGKDQKVLPDQAHLLYGQSSVTLGLQEQKNWLYLRQGNSFIVLCPSAFGKPFNKEFELENPVKVECRDLGDCNQLEIFYLSKKIPGLKFSKLVNLYTGGEMELSLRFENIPESQEDIILRELVGFDTSKLSFAHDNELLRLPEELAMTEINDLHAEDISENWLYSEKGHKGSGMIWDKDWKINLNHWWVGLEYNVSELRREEKKQTTKINIYAESFVSAYQLRNYYLQRYQPKIPTRKTVDLTFCQANPILDSTVEMKLDIRQDLSLDKKIRVEELKWSATAKANHNYLLGNPQPGLNLLHSTLEMDATDLSFAHLLFKPNKGISYTQDQAGLAIENGVLSLAARQDSRLPLLSSLKHQDLEWLDIAYPEFAPKSSFNPYPGGMIYYPASLKLSNLLEESHTLEKSELIDQFGNVWQGLSWRTKISAYEPYKDLEYRQHYLCLPGLAVIAMVIELIQPLRKAGFSSFALQSFYHPDNIRKTARCGYYTDEQSWMEAHSGSNMYVTRDLSRHLRVKSRGTTLNLVGLSQSYAVILMNQELMYTKTFSYTDIVNQPGAFLEPLFMIYTPFDLHQDMVNDLLALKFCCLDEKA